MFLGSISLAIVLVLSVTFAEEFSPNDAPSGKRAPMGFQGMRGKKDLASSSENEEFAKRAPMGFQGMRGKKDSVGDFEDNSIESDEELEKRAVMGFQGMRGKKDFLTRDFADSYLRDTYLKRAPMGFQGMRGKKVVVLRGDDFYKRGMGFQGTRGEKSLDLLLDEIRNRRYGSNQGRTMYLIGHPDDHEKRAPAMGFQGMRGKRRELEDGWKKRAPMGFQGMRGKKSLLEAMEDVEKRAIMGFQGMRGKKDIESNYYEDYKPVHSVDYPKSSGLSEHEFDKWSGTVERKPTGLEETRDKRDAFDYGNWYGNGPATSQYRLQDPLTDDTTDDLLLRAGFWDGMNVVPLQFDKRSSYGYFGTRGKKIPRWEIRRKFVGVRGKKWSSTPNYEDGNPLNSAPRSNIERPGVKADSTASL